MDGGMNRWMVDKDVNTLTDTYLKTGVKQYWTASEEMRQRKHCLQTLKKKIRYDKKRRR